MLKALIARGTTSASPDLDQLVTTFLAGQQYYLPARLFPRSVCENVRQAFEFPPSEEVDTDTAFAALRYLHALIGLAERHSLLEDAAAAAKKSSRSRAAGRTKAHAQASAQPCPESWVHAAGSKALAILPAHAGRCCGDFVSTGARLSLACPSAAEVAILHMYANAAQNASPAVFLQSSCRMCRGFFRRTVVLIVSTSPTQGSSGFCLNKVVGKRVTDYVEGNPEQASALLDLLTHACANACPLFPGVPCLCRSWTMTAPSPRSISPMSPWTWRTLI